MKFKATQKTISISQQQQAQNEPTCMIDNLTCTEIPQQGSRSEKVFILPDGSAVTLQRVNIRIMGTVTVSLNDVTTDPMDFSICESYYLCAPSGTEINCQVTDSSCQVCTVTTSESGTDIEVIIDLCVDVKSTANVTLGLEAAFCNPREQQIERTCPNPVHPPQCPSIFGNAGASPEQKCPIIYSNSLEVAPQQEENLCIRADSVYDWIQNRVNTTVTINIPPPLFCVYIVSEVVGECGDIVTGDVICFPCDEPCEETLQCTNDTCSLTLTRRSEDCVPCPLDAVTLPVGFYCAIPSCVYTVNDIAGECLGLTEGDLICFPCEEPCAETLLCSNQTCSIELERTTETCLPCPQDAVPLPTGLSCTIPTGRILNVNTGVYYDFIAEAVEAAEDNQTLLVTPGAYPQDAELIIDKSLTIRGFSADETEITFSAAFTGATAVSLEADNITLEGLSFMRELTGAADETLLRIPAEGVEDYYDGITIQNSRFEGGQRTLIINASNLTLLNNTIIHTGNTERSVEIRGTFGETQITGNTFQGNATSLAALYFEPDTPVDVLRGTFRIENNVMARHSQFVLFDTGTMMDVSIFVERNTIDHEDRVGSSIIFLPQNFPGVDTILIQENDITNLNTGRLAVYVDYSLGNSPAATNQIQVFRNTMRFYPPPWGRVFDIASNVAPVGFRTPAPPQMNINAFELVDNIVITT
ncbi:hypothetical protein [Halobacillus sp. K22]|uniref:hypothetical protein n=1 Tax=Halobacillus sp. K22 TaxID=3457431 RepID=UPI003FCE7CCB